VRDHHWRLYPPGDPVKPSAPDQHLILRAKGHHAACPCEEPL